MARWPSVYRRALLRKQTGDGPQGIDYLGDPGMV